MRNWYDGPDPELNGDGCSDPYSGNGDGCSDPYSGNDDGYNDGCGDDPGDWD